MGRVCYGPSLSWAEFVMGRVVQLPFGSIRLENSSTKDALVRTSSFKIYQYGLAVLSLNKKQVNELEKFYLETLKNIQLLPKRTANSVTYLLLDVLPLKAEMDR